MTKIQGIECIIAGDTCGLSGAKFIYFPISVKAFIFANSKSQKIFRLSIKRSENPTILKELRGPWPPIPPAKLSLIIADFKLKSVMVALSLA